MYYLAAAIMRMFFTRYIADDLSIAASTTSKTTHPVTIATIAMTATTLAFLASVTWSAICRTTLASVNKNTLHLKQDVDNNRLCSKNLYDNDGTM